MSDMEQGASALPGSMVEDQVIVNTNNSENKKNKIHGANEETVGKETSEILPSPRESSTESGQSGWASSELDRSSLIELASHSRTEVILKTLIRWMGVAILLTASLLRFSVLSLPYFTLFLLSFVPFRKLQFYFRYYEPSRGSIILLAILLAYSFLCVVFEVVIAALLGTGRYAPTASALQSLQSIGVADFHKSVSSGLRGILPDIFVLIFSGTSMGLNLMLFRKRNTFRDLLLQTRQSTLVEKSQLSNTLLKNELLAKEEDYISRNLSRRITLSSFYIFTLLLSITFASVATSIFMIAVDVVLFIWAIGPVALAKMHDARLDRQKLKDSSYYERILLAQVPSSFVERVLERFLSFPLLKRADLTTLQIRAIQIIDALLLIYSIVLYIFQWPWLANTLLSSTCHVIGIVPLGKSNAPEWPYNLTFALMLCAFSTGGIFVIGHSETNATETVTFQELQSNSLENEVMTASSNALDNKGNIRADGTTQSSGIVWEDLFFNENGLLIVASQILPYFANLSVVIWAVVFPGALSTILLFCAGSLFLFPISLRMLNWPLLIYMMCIVVATNLYNAVPSSDISVSSQRKALEAGLKRADTTIWVMAIEMLSVVLFVIYVRLYYQISRRRAHINSKLKLQATADTSSLHLASQHSSIHNWRAFIFEYLWLDQFNPKDGDKIDWRDSQEADYVLIFLVWFSVPIEALAMIALFFSAGIVVSAVDSVFLIFLGLVGFLYFLPSSKFQSWVRLIVWNLCMIYQVVVLVMNGCICRFMSGGAHCNVSGGIVGSELSSLFAYIVFLFLGSLQLRSIQLRYIAKYQFSSRPFENGQPNVVEVQSYVSITPSARHPYLLLHIDEFFRFSWLYICYILIVADALLFPANYLAFAYLLMALILLVIELLVSVQLDPRSVVRRIWFIIVLFSAAIVSLRYIVRFRSVYSNLSPNTAHAVIRTGIDAGVGFQVGDVIVYVACILQLKIFSKTIPTQCCRKSETLSRDDSRTVQLLFQVFVAMLSFAGSLFIWSSRLVLVLFVLVSSIWLSGVSALSYVYIFLCVVLLLFESEAKYNYILELRMANRKQTEEGESTTSKRASMASPIHSSKFMFEIFSKQHVTSVWTSSLLALYSFCVICLQLFYIVWVYEGHDPWNAAYWLGLASGPRAVPLGSKRMAGNILVLVFSVLHRLAQRKTLKDLKDSATEPDVRETEHEQITYGNATQEAVDNNTNDSFSRLPSTERMVENNSYSSHLMNLFNRFFYFLHRLWFWGCVDSTLIYLMMAAVIVRTIVSLVYVVLVAILLIPTSQLVSRRLFWLAAYVLSALLIVQYAVSLGLWPPESVNVTWPWHDLSIAWQRWFFIDVGFRGYDWSLALTFGGLILSSMVLDVEREDKIKTTFNVVEEPGEDAMQNFLFSKGTERIIETIRFLGCIGFSFFVLAYAFAAATSIPNVMTYVLIVLILVIIWKFEWFMSPPFLFWKSLVFYTLFILFVELVVQFPFSLGTPVTSWEAVLGCYKGYTKHGIQMFSLMLFLLTFLLIECRIYEHNRHTVMTTGMKRLRLKRFLRAVHEYTVRYFRVRELFRMLEKDREARKVRLHKIKELRSQREKKMREDEHVLDPFGFREEDTQESKLKETLRSEKKMANDDELLGMQLAAPDAPVPGEVTDSLQGGLSQWQSIKQWTSQTASTLRSGAATRPVFSRNSISRPSVSVRDFQPSSTRNYKEMLSTRKSQPSVPDNVEPPRSSAFSQASSEDKKFSASKPSLFGIASAETVAEKQSVSMSAEVGRGYVDLSALKEPYGKASFDGLNLKKLNLEEIEEEQSQANGNVSLDWYRIDDIPRWLQSPFIIGLNIFVEFLFKHSEWMVYFFMVLAFLMNRTLLTFVYVMYLFLYLFIESPRPRRNAWLCLLTYVEAVIVFKLVVLLPALANERNGIAASTCGGVHYFYIANSKINTVTVCTLGTGIFFDVLILFSIMLHRIYLWTQGLWDLDILVSETSEENMTSSVQETMADKHAGDTIKDKVTNLAHRVLHPFGNSEKTQPMMNETVFISERVVDTALHEGIFLAENTSKADANGSCVQNVTEASSSLENAQFILAQNNSNEAKATLKISNVRFGKDASEIEKCMKRKDDNRAVNEGKKRLTPKRFCLLVKDTSGNYMQAEVWTEIVPISSTDSKGGKMNKGKDGCAAEESNKSSTSSTLPPSTDTSTYDEFDLADSIRLEKNGQIAAKQRPKSAFVQKIQKFVPSFVFQYYQRILNVDGIKPGVDYYLLTFAIDFICLLYILFLFPLMFAPIEARVAVTETAWWSTNLMSVKQILTLLALFVGLILDRIFYLRRIMFGKLILYYANVIVFHLVIFVIGDFDQRATLIVFYVLKLVSFILGGLQVRHGFPPYTHGQFLLRRFSAWGMFFFNLYYMTPFLYELRTILDWTMIPTSMEYFDWLKYSDVWISLYRNKAMNNNRAWQKRWLGKKRIATVKFWLGAMLVLLLSFLLWIPFIVFSAINPFEAYQPIENARLTLSLATGSQVEVYKSDITAPSIATSVQRKFSSNINVNLLADTSQGKTYWFEFSVDSNVIWQPPQHLLKQVEKQLGSTSNGVELLSSLVVTSSGGNTYQYVSTYTLSVAQQNLLKDSLQKKTIGGFLVPSLIPRYLAIDSTTSSSGLSVLAKGYASACVKLAYENVSRTGVFSNSSTFSWNETQSYWQVASCNASGMRCANCANDAVLTAGSSRDLGASSLPNYVVYLRSGSSGGILGKFAAGGILALVVYIFFSIGGMVRRMFENQKMEIPYYYMPYTDNLLSLVYDIIRARQDGDCAMEEFLFWELIDLYRSQERMIKWSGERQLYPEFQWWLPPFKLQRWTMYKQMDN
eukprot:jgi/Galph1/2581/GphlegSOOS_G1260.1